MVANINSLNATQNTSSAPQPGQAASSGSGQSFTNVLQNEIQASTPPAAAAPVTPSPVTTASVASKPDTTSTTGNGTAPVTKKTAGTNQTQSSSASDQAAAAATAAALAAVTGSPANKSPTADSAANDATAISADQTATTQTSSQFAALTNTVANNGTSTPNGKATLDGNATAGADSKTPDLSLNAQNIIASAVKGGSMGKNTGQQSGEFASALTKSSQEVSAKGSSNSAPSTISESATASTAPNNAAADAANTQALNNVPLTTLKSSNENLSAAQLNAIAPVLTNNVPDAAKPADTIAPQVGAPGWDQAVGQKINWMVNGGQQSASLTLNPPELGPMQIVLSVNNLHASATFSSHQPEVRAALENAIPKLREMLGQSGIQLGDCNVNSQARQQEFAQNQSGSGNNGSNTISGNDSNVSIISSNSATTARSGVGLVDTFV